MFLHDLFHDLFLDCCLLESFLSFSHFFLSFPFLSFPLFFLSVSLLPQDDMTEALGVAPGDYRLYQQRGIARYARHNFEGAISDLFAALEILEEVDDRGVTRHEVMLTRAEMNRYLSYSFANSGDHDRAVERMDVVIEIGVMLEEEALKEIATETVRAHYY